METIKLNTEVTGVKKLLTGKTKKVIIKKYYDLNGQCYDEGTETKTFKEDKNFEIVEKKVKYNWGFGMKPTTFKEWEVYIDGKRYYEDCEITGYKHNTMQLVLEGCVGAG